MNDSVSCWIEKARTDAKDEQQYRQHDNKEIVIPHDVTSIDLQQLLSHVWFVSSRKNLQLRSRQPMW